MTAGILFGLTAACLNASGYLLAARFLKHYHSPIRMALLVQVGIMCLAIPFIPFIIRPEDWSVIRTLWGHFGLWALYFTLGQSSFFAAQRSIEPSRLASFLGLKIIVLTVLTILIRRIFPTPGQFIAILMTASAAFLINKTGGKVTVWGAIFTFSVLLFYSLTDMEIAVMMRAMCQSGAGPVRSSLVILSLGYCILGTFSCIGFFFLRPTKRQFVMSGPYAILWLLSQISIFSCYALIDAVFGNVVLASRGLVSVLFGVLLVRFGIRGLDAKISRKQWIFRALAALMMAAAIALYSFAGR